MIIWHGTMLLNEVRDVAQSEGKQGFVGLVQGLGLYPLG